MSGCLLLSIYMSLFVFLGLPFSVWLFASGLRVSGFVSTLGSLSHYLYLTCLCQILSPSTSISLHSLSVRLFVCVSRLCQQSGSTKAGYQSRCRRWLRLINLTIHRRPTDVRRFLKPSRGREAEEVEERRTEGRVRRRKEGDGNGEECVRYKENGGESVRNRL